MKNYLFVFLFTNALIGNCGLTPMVPYNPQPLDTVKVYNVYCSYFDGNVLSAWGGNYSSFFPPVECPQKNIELYLANRKTVAEYLFAQKFFWMKLYNTEDQLIFESLKHSDCRVGKFICYWPNGEKMLTGQYDGAVVNKKTGEYILKKCAGEKVGTWCHYDKKGMFVNYETY